MKLFNWVETKSVATPPAMCPHCGKPMYNRTKSIVFPEYERFECANCDGVVTYVEKGTEVGRFRSLPYPRL